jgi:hypothetical protein
VIGGFAFVGFQRNLVHKHSTAWLAHIHLYYVWGLGRDYLCFRFLIIHPSFDFRFHVFWSRFGQNLLLRLLFKIQLGFEVITDYNVGAAQDSYHMASGICPLGWRKIIEFYYGSRSRCLYTLVFLKFNADYLIGAKSLSNCVVVLNLLKNFALHDQHIAWLIFDGWLESLDFCLKLEITSQGNIFFWLCEVCVKFGRLKLLGVLRGSWLIV